MRQCVFFEPKYLIRVLLRVGIINHHMPGEDPDLLQGHGGTSSIPRGVFGHSSLASARTLLFTYILAGATVFSTNHSGAMLLAKGSKLNSF
jgi:hypothetical protein